MATFTNSDGLSVELDEAAVIDLKYLAHLTRETEPVSFKAAVDGLRAATLKPPKKESTGRTNRRRPNGESS